MLIRSVHYILISLIFLGWSCQQESSLDVQALATVGDRIITADEFKKRSELTLRPVYCDGSSESDKGIILNTLVAEKLLALAAESDPEIVSDPFIRDYVQGVKEQKMRKLLLESELAEQLEIPTDEKLAAIQQATKKLIVSYVYSSSLDEIESWKAQINAGMSFDDLEKSVNKDKPPHRKEVLWGENLQSIENALFTDAVDVGSLVGPVGTPAGYYLIKVTDLRREALVTQEQLEKAQQKVEDVLWQRKWDYHSANYVYQLMKEKAFKLDEQGFALLLEYYQPTHALPDTREEFLNIDQGERELLKQKAQHALQQNLHLPLLTVGEEIWTLNDFVAFTRRRPLMFRKEKIREDEFPRYLKLAIKDLLRDKYLTEAAYEKKWDEHPQVLAEAQRWQDHMRAVTLRNKLLKQRGFESKITENYHEAINILRPELNTLAKRYPITIDEGLVKKTPLTGVQWMALHNGMPYQSVVPSMPVITNDERLDYLTYFNQYAMGGNR